jgi:spore maturation protein B
MSFADLIIPILFIILLVAAKVKRVNAYNSFVDGAKRGFWAAIDLLPYVAAIFLAIMLFRQSGLIDLLVRLLSPALSLLGIPAPLTELILLKPLSGSGSLAVLSEIYETHGVDSYIGRTASIIMGSSETVFYVSTIYFAGTKVTSTGKALALGLMVSFISVLLSCWVCRLFF